MVQGVRDVFEIVDLEGGSRDGGAGVGSRGREGKLVLIGRGLDEGAFEGSLRGWLE